MSPPNTRYFIRRKLDMSIGNIHTAQEHLLEVATPFETVHPEYYEAFKAIIVALETIVPTVEAMRDKI